MEIRVEQLSAQAGVSVDTVRYYQNKGLLDPPRREGRIAWYGPGHLDRLTRIRALQQRGFTLATIARLVSGDLDAADEALLGQLSGLDATGETTSGATTTGELPEGQATYTLEELAGATGVPLALVKAIQAEGLLVPTRVGGQACYTDEDVAATKAGLLLLEWGIPLSALLEVARRHAESTDAVARQAVDLFSRYVREPIRQGAYPDARAEAAGTTERAATGDPAVDGLLQAYAELLPAVNTLVGHHFTRTLVRVALEHVEQVGSDEERRAVQERIRSESTAPVRVVDGTVAG